MSRHSEWLKTTEIQYCPTINSNNKLLAPAVKFIKRILRKLFLFIGNPLVEDINAYHRRLVLELEDMQTVTAVLRSKVEDRREIEALHAEVEALHIEMEALHAEMNAMQASISVLYVGSNASDERYLALHRLANLSAQMLEPLTLEYHKRKFGIIDDTEVPLTRLTSSLARRKEIIAYAQWARQMHIEPTIMNRKNWEWIYIAQALFEHDMLKPGMKGLGFAVGSEPLSALFARYGVMVTATDLGDDNPETESWKQGNQHANNLSIVEHPEICDQASFDSHVRFMPLDMNNIPDTLRGFDFCWSSCAFEHLGSIEQGRAFVLNTLDVLKPGGVSVHTTEFNLSTDESVDEIPYYSIYGKNFFNDLRHEITAMGHYFAPFDYRLGEHPDEDYIFKFKEPTAHFKLLIGNYISTSIGIIIVKKTT